MGAWSICGACTYIGRGSDRGETLLAFKLCCQWCALRQLRTGYRWPTLCLPLHALQFFCMAGLTPPIHPAILQFLVVVIVVMTVLILMASACACRIILDHVALKLAPCPRVADHVVAHVFSADILVYFQAEEDRNTAWMPKVAVVLGLTLASLVVLLPPLDVANRSSGGELDVSLLYQVMFVSIAILVVVVIPFLIFYYEADEPESARGHLCRAMVYEAVTLASAATVLVLMWIFLGRAQIPVTHYVYEGQFLDATAPTPAAGCGLGSGCVAGKSNFYEIGVTPVVYIMALSSFVGWFFLALFGGIGMAALPLDLMLAYKSRPQSISLQVIYYLRQRTLRAAFDLE